MYSEWLDGYKAGGFQEVEGWVDGRLLHVLKALHAVQENMGVRGGALEIGVHHGRFFMALNGMVSADEGPSFALDLFDDQALNIDSSGHGNKTAFEENLSLYDRHAGRNVHLLAGDSTRLRFNDLSRLCAIRPKVVSVDGGHTVEHTISDLIFVEAVVHDRGAVFLDDILNPQWVGVFEGAVTYLGRKPTLWPIFIGYNKLILVPMSVHALYIEQMKKAFPASKLVYLCGYSLLAV